MEHKYHHLSSHDRIKIELAIEQGHSASGIARIVGVHRSTIYREMRRGADARLERYLACRGDAAYQQARRRAGLQRRKLGQDLNSPAWLFVRTRLGAGWSPQQICGRTRLLGQLLGLPLQPHQCFSHTTIYKAIFDLPHGPARAAHTKLLRRSTGGRRRPRRPRSARFTGIQDLRRISERPLSAFDRLLPGHWEGDLVKGANGRSSVITLVERTSRFTLLLPLPRADALSFKRAVIAGMRHLPAHLRLSITYDRGTEMALHKRISRSLNMPIYFCEPYSPWQRPTNENTNGLLRQFLPKGLDLSLLTRAELQAVENALNDRPRQVLNFQTPREVLHAAIGNA